MTISPLRLSLLAALSLHLLGLAGWQLLRSRSTPVSRLQAQDDTPILLQFSRQEPLTADQAAIPLPPAAPLPLPSNGGGAALSLPAAQNPGSGSTRRGQSARSATSVTPSPSRKGSGPQAPGSGAKAKGDLRSGKSRLPETGGRTAAAPLALGPGSAARGALLTLLHDLGPSHPGEGSETGRGDAKSEANGDGSDPVGNPSHGLANRGQGTGAMDAKATAAELRLWALGRIPTTPPSGLEGVPGTLSIRQLPLREARRSGAELSHRRVIRLEDGALLLWIDGGTLWLLRASLP